MLEQAAHRRGDGAEVVDAVGADRDDGRAGHGTGQPGAADQRSGKAVGGKKVQLAPGRVLLAEDVTGKGHTTRVGADEDLVMLLVPLASQP